MNTFAPNSSARLAQSVEQKPKNLEVLSSNPVRCVIYFFYFFCVSVLTKTRNSACKRAYGTTGRPAACLNSLCSLCTACGRAMLFWHFRHFDRK